MTTGKRIVRRRGDIVQINLGDSHSYAIVLRKPLFAFFAIETALQLSGEELLREPILFTIAVMDYAVTRGLWPVTAKIAQSRLEAFESPLFFKQDKLTKKLTAYCDADGSERLITFEEAGKLEAAAVWDPSHVEDRLRDHFAGRENKWLKALRPQPVN